MNKGELIERLAKKTGLKLRMAKSVVDVLFGTDRNGLLASELRAGRKVRISGFGTFERRRRKPRPGRNPRTGEKIEIGPSLYPAFRAGRSLRQRMK